MEVSLLPKVTDGFSSSWLDEEDEEDEAGEADPEDFDVAMALDMISDDLQLRALYTTTIIES